MQQKVIYVQASESDPNTREIDEICQRMADDGLSLVHVAPSQGEGGVTGGLWLFFSELDETTLLPNNIPVGSGAGSSMLSPFRYQMSMASPDPPAETPAFWWHEMREKKGLGLSLTLTGVMALISGFLLHIALRNDLIDTTLRLGYFFGIVGLLLFLIGLLIVF